MPFARRLAFAASSGLGLSAGKPARAKPTKSIGTSLEIHTTAKSSPPADLGVDGPDAGRERSELDEVDAGLGNRPHGYELASGGIVPRQLARFHAQRGELPRGRNPDGDA